VFGQFSPFRVECHTDCGGVVVGVGTLLYLNYNKKVLLIGQ